MIRINNILDKISEYYPNPDVDVVERAYIYSARVHAGQVRLSGEPYLMHPLEVANILADMKLDAVSVAAGLLHDVLEDTPTRPTELRELFGPDVERIVSGVTKLSLLPTSSSQERQAENIRKMFLAMADDIRVILIKLADRLHNMRTLRFHPPEKRRAIARETMDIYAPDRRPARDLLDQERAGGELLQVPEPGGVRPDRACWSPSPGTSASSYIENVRGTIRQRMEDGEPEVRGARPQQELLQHLLEDEGPEPRPSSRSTTSSPSASSSTPCPSATRPWV